MKRVLLLLALLTSATLWAETQSDQVIDTSVYNTTTATLGSGGVFTGSSEYLGGYSGVVVNVFATPSNASGTLTFQFSPDNVHWDVSVPVPVADPTAQPPLPLIAVEKYFRVIYTNGSVVQTAFRLTTKLTRKPLGPLIRLPSQSTSIGEPVAVVKALVEPNQNGAGSLSVTVDGGAIAISNLPTLQQVQVDGGIVQVVGGVTIDGGFVAISNLPVQQTVWVDGGLVQVWGNVLIDGGSVTVSNLPALQQVAGNILVDGGSINVANFPSNQNVTISPLQTTQVYPNSNALPTRPIYNHDKISAFGSLLAAQEVSEVHLQFGYNVNTDMANVITNGGATVSTSNAKAVLSTGTGAAANAQIESKKAVRYVPGAGISCRFTAIFSTGVASSTQEIGIGDSSNGFFFGYNGTAFGILRRQNSVDTWIPQSSWNVDKMDGTGVSGVTLDPTKGQPYQISYQWLGFGAIDFFAEAPEGEFVLVHTIKYAGSATTPSTFNPNLPLHAKVFNSGNTSNVILQTSSMGAVIQGNIDPQGSRNSRNNRKTAVSTETSIITLQNKGTYQTIPNHIRVKIDFLSIAVTSSTTSIDTTFRVVRNATLGGTPSYTDVSTNTSVISYDTAGTTVTGGQEVMAFIISGNNNENANIRELDVFLLPGETLTFSAQSTSGSVNAQVGVSWDEEF